MKQRLLIFLFPLVLALSSCLGLSMNIDLNQNGSGTVTLEYRIAESLDGLGRLDGNERWNTIPVGRADFERTLDRIPGTELLSFSAKEDKDNLIIAAKMGFRDIEGLLAFLDASGSRSSFSGSAGSGRLVFTLNEGRGGGNTGSGIDRLIEEISKPYSVKLGMSFPGEGSLTIKDSRGAVISAVPGAEIQPRGKNVFCSFPLDRILNSPGGIKAEFSW